jgi:sulfur relay (sulfurtransferase) complex TusBCD TusD component (DsrE family)
MEKFLFVISKGFEKSGAATRALQLASITAGKGLHVVVFFIDDAIHWAQLGMAEGIRSTTGEHMKDILDELISKKTPIHVCAACANKRLVSPDDCVEGCVMSAATVLVDMMINPEYKVFTF